MEQTENFKEISFSDSDSEKEVLKEKVESPGLANLSAERLSGEEVSKVANGLNISEVTSNSQDTFDETTSVVNYVRHDEVYDGKTSNTVAQDLEDLIDKALELGSATPSTRYYGLPSMEESVSKHHQEVTKSMQRYKPYISKAERRKLKKGHKDGSEISTAEHGKETEDDNSVSQPDNETKSSKPISGKISRGQKGKLKKIKEKYADQDEEERLIRMALLAAAGKSKDVKKSENEKALPGAELNLLRGHKMRGTVVSLTF